jgi:hypothetical protein
MGTIRERIEEDFELFAMGTSRERMERRTLGFSR